MIKHLKLTKAIVAMVLGLLALIAAKVLEAYKMDGDQALLSLAGIFFIASAIIFLYPIVFAKKADKFGRSVELEPFANDLGSEENKAS